MTTCVGLNIGRLPLFVCVGELRDFGATHYVKPALMHAEAQRSAAAAPSHLRKWRRHTCSPPRSKSGSHIAAQQGNVWANTGAREGRNRSGGGTTWEDAPKIRAG